MRFAILVALGMTFLLAIPSSTAGCSWTTSQPELDTCNVGGTGRSVKEVTTYCYYLEVDLRPYGNVFVYRESNGLPGLQRGDEYKDDTCFGMISADKLVI